jgi:tRNA A-37 threonylcarbamoyl transferase component Bud32
MVSQPPLGYRRRMGDDAPAVDRAATASWHGDVTAQDRAELAARDPVAPPRYELLEELGRGGMAIVRAATDRQLNRRVAIKLLRPEQIHATGRARLIREAQALAQLRHPNVVAVYDVGVLGGHDFLAMELVVGPTLRSWMKGRSWRALVRVFIAAGRGLAAAHAVGLVHRDFKPDNVLIEADGTPKVGDFGLARLADDHALDEPGPDSGELAVSVTRTDVVVGTLGYVAPEVLAGEPADARADQFAFAVALVEALTGARPFAGTTPVEHAAAIARGPRLPRVASPPIRAALARALAVDPGARFPSMTALLGALEAALGRRRRAAVAGGVLAIAGALGAVAVLAPGGGGPPACAIDDHALDGVWDAPRRAALAAAFARVPSSYAATIARDVTTALDAYAAAMQGASLAACTAAASPAQTDAVTDLRAACLQRRRDQLGLVVDALIRVSDANTLARAPGAVDGLAGIAECADVAALKRPLTIPADPALAAQVAEVRREIDRISVETRLTHFQAVIGDAQAVAQRAIGLHHAPTEAEALHVLASAEQGVDDIGHAVDHENAALLAAQAGHDDELVVRAAAGLGLMIGRLEGRPAEGRRWAELAVATADGLGKPPALERYAHFAMMVLHRAEHHLDDAAREGAIALDASHAAHDSDLIVSEVTNTLGGIALDRGDYASAQGLYLRARALVVAHYGEDHPMVLVFDSNLASIALALGDNPAAIATRRRVAEAKARTLGADAPRTGEAWLVLAETMAATGDGAAAIPLARRGAAIVRAATDLPPARRASAQAQLALVLLDGGATDEARAIGLATLGDLPDADADGPRAGLLITLAGAALIDQPLPAQRAAIARAAAAVAKVPGDDGAEAAMAWLQARLLRVSGDPHAAAAAADARARLARSEGAAAGIVGAAALDQGLALVAAGDRAAAVEPITAAVALLRGPRWIRDQAAAVAAQAALSPARTQGAPRVSP